MSKALFLVCLFLAGCHKSELPKKTEHDFESLMGKSLPAWEYIQTKEDFENLAYFKNIYERNCLFLSSVPLTLKIPKTLHYIWVGPQSFPRESVDFVRSWVGKHPDWKIKFWTDRERPLPHPAMELCYIKDFPFHRLEKQFYQSDNFGEKSDVLRYEILYREGGVYVDHDVKCIKPFDAFNQAYDLYCGMEMPSKTSLSSPLLPTNNLLASKPGHLILKQCMDWLEQNWDRIEKDYPGKDRDSVINRVAHRSFFVLGETFKKYANQNGNIDIAFPAFYFNAPKDENALYARHMYRGTWFENESIFEKMVRERLVLLSKKTNKILLFFGAMSAINMIGFASLFIAFKSRKKFSL